MNVSCVYVQKSSGFLESREGSCVNFIDNNMSGICTITKLAGMLQDPSEFSYLGVCCMKYAILGIHMLFPINGVAVGERISHQGFFDGDRR